MFKPGRYKTRDGRDAVVLCNDAPGSEPLVGYVFLGGEKVSARSWSAEGVFDHFWPNGPSDLMPPVRVEYWVTRANWLQRLEDGPPENFPHYRVELQGDDVVKMERVKP